MMKIVILDGHTLNPGDLSWKAIEAIAETTIYERTAPEELIERSTEADIILTNKVKIGKAEIDALPRLKYIGVLATGYNVVDTQTAKEKGIVVTNIPSYSTSSVAQMVWAHILNITNRVSHYAEQNANERWSKSEDFCYWDFPHVELKGKNLGIVGLGNTGMATAQIALAFEMKVLAYTSKQTLPEGISKVSMDELFAKSDIVSLHCPLTETTHGLVNMKRLKTMKPTAIVINTGRGPLIVEEEVAEALNNGIIAAYGADVLCEEPAKANNPLLKAKNSFVTPHIAWATIEARERLMNICIENIKAFIEGNPINVVNR